MHIDVRIRSRVTKVGVGSIPPALDGEAEPAPVPAPTVTELLENTWAALHKIPMRVLSQVLYDQTAKLLYLWVWSIQNGL